MNDFLKIADKVFKPVVTIAGIILGLAVTYGAGSYLSFASVAYGGFYTFMYVLLWIAFIVLIICGVYALFKKYAAAVPQQTNNNVQSAAPAQAQPQNSGATYCPTCGGSVPAGNQFCPNCGNKINQ